MSHIVSAMINAHNAIFEDTDMEKGKVYKLRSPSYIRRGQTYSLCRMEFTDGLFEDEVTLVRSKKDYEETYKTTPIFKQWKKVQPHSNSGLSEEPPHFGVIW